MEDGEEYEEDIAGVTEFLYTEHDEQVLLCQRSWHWNGAKYLREVKISGLERGLHSEFKLQNIQEQ